MQLNKEVHKLYINSGYWHQTRLDFKDKKHPLFIGSCGTYRLYTVKRLPTHRPRGRLDYQLLYVASGKAHFYFSGEEKIISAGNMVLYRPKEEQRYYYYAAEQPEIYWVHFTGNNVKNILRKYGITDDTSVIYSGVSMEYKRLYLSMIQELQMKREDYEELLVHYFMQLLISIHRQILVKPRKKNLMLQTITLALDGLSRTSSSIRRQHRRSISSLCASRMQNCFWKLRIIMYPRFQISSAMKIRCISAGSSKSNVVCRRFSSENSFLLRMRKTAIQLDCIISYRKNVFERQLTAGLFKHIFLIFFYFLFFCIARK